MCWQDGVLHSILDVVERWERKSRGADGGVDLSGKMESQSLLNAWTISCALYMKASTWIGI